VAAKPQPAGPPEEEKDWAFYSRRSQKKLYSELDVLLKALERYFDPENHQEGNPAGPGRDYSKELAIVRDGALRGQTILECVMPESRRNSYWFQKFAEQKLLPEAEKDSFREWVEKQDTPEKGLYLIYDTLINIKNVIGELLKGGNAGYSSFLGIGQILSRQIRSNRHFNPFRREINQEFDIIENREISALVKGIPDREERKTVSMVFLYLFRFLRYLNQMDLATQRAVALHVDMLVLFLLRHEIQIFSKKAESYSEQAPPELANILGSIAYQFSMEQRRVFRQEMRDILSKSSGQQRGKIENSHGILKNLTEQVTIMLAQSLNEKYKWKREIRGEDIFENYFTRIEQSLRLRDDVAVLHRLISLLEKKARSPRERAMLVAALQNYMSYFESFTFRLLRYEDYEEFASFFVELAALLKKSEKEFDRLFEKCMQFKIYLETALRHVANRAELKEKPLLAHRVDERIKQYLSS
jgi:archaeosine-15-forming tRNA-guanine transglycosylase